MKIIVCVKQVPDTAEVRIDPEKGTLVRKGVPAVVNPLDLHALEAAVQLVERHGGTVHVLSMGPAAAEEALRECLAFGADTAWLCTGSGFAGADTWATAVTLAAAVRYIGGADLVLCGKQAIDGDTAQVGPELAVRLGWPLIPYAEEVSAIAGPSGGGTQLEVRSMSDTGCTVLRSPLPAVVTAVKDISVPRLPTLPGWGRALSGPVTRITPAALRLPAEETGLKGSPTRVRKIRGVVHTKQTEFLDPGSDETVRRIADILLRAGAGKSNPRDSSGPAEAAMPSAAAAENDTTGSSAYIAVLGELNPEGCGLSEVSFELCAAARTLAAAGEHTAAGKSRVVCAVPGCGLEERLAGTRLPDADEVVWIETGTEVFEVNRYAAAAAAWAEQAAPEILLGPGTLIGRAMMPLVAARLGAGLTADCTGLSIDTGSGLLLQTRPAFGGNVLATIACAHRRPQMATVRPHVFSSAGTARMSAAERRTAGLRMPRLFRPAGAGDTGFPAVVEETRTITGGPDIADARAVLAGGRGLGGPDGFTLLERAAGLTGGAVAASRSAVEAGWAVYPRQVGQTGKTVQPAVYFAVGISGAVQHIVGMHDSEYIIALNRDPDAPIFRAADIGIAADYRSFLIRLIKTLEAKEEHR